jgi:RHS repeat-associated protein
LTQAVWEGTTTSYSYDLRGNLTKKGGTEYYWDSQDHMTKVYDGWKTMEYKYDLMGRRVAKRVTYPGYGSLPWRWYFYDGLKVIAEGTTTTNRTYYTNSPAVIGGIITDGTAWYHYDRLGNVVAKTDMGGTPCSLYTMDAFGNVLQKGDQYYGYGPESGGTDGGYHLTTKEFDSDSGLYYFNARWYDPTTGRFVSREPLVGGILGGVNLAYLGYVSLAGITYYELAAGDSRRWNTYSFCLNAPTNYVDTDGAFPWPEIIGGAIGAVVGCLIMVATAYASCAAGIKGGAFIGGVLFALAEAVSCTIPYVKKKLKPVVETENQKRKDERIDPEGGPGRDGLPHGNLPDSVELVRPISIELYLPCP